MADTNVAPSGAETSISLTVNGAPKVVAGQVDGFTFKEESTVYTTMPIGTMNAPKGKDLRGYSGTISAKPTNPTLHQVMDLVRAATRLGLPSEVSIKHTIKFRDGTQTRHTYRQVVLHSDAGSTKRGEAVGLELQWETGYERVSS